MSSDNGLPVRQRSRSPPGTPPDVACPPRSLNIQDCIHEICRRGQSCAEKDVSTERLRKVLKATVDGIKKSQEPGATMSQVARAAKLSHTLFPNEESSSR